MQFYSGMPAKDSYQVGDTVLAKWPGSSLYYDAEVLSVEKNGAKVKFSEGTEETVNFKFISKSKTSRQSRSPARAKRSPSKSPGRKKSPARGRSKSPARGRSKSPTRAVGRPRSTSRSRTTKKEKSASPEKKTKEEPKKESVVGTRRRREASQNKITETPKPDDTKRRATPVRSSSRLAAAAQTSNNNKLEGSGEANSKSKKVLDMPSSESSKQSDKKTLTSHLVTHLMIVLIPAMCIGIQFLCYKTHCSVTKLPPYWPTSISAYLTLETFGVYFAWLSIIFFFSALPIGKVYSSDCGGRTLLFRCNGFLLFLLTLVGAAACEYFGFHLSYIRKNYLRLSCASVVMSFVIAIGLYIKSIWAAKSNLNPEGNTGCWPTDFFVGREVNPRFGQTFDIKLFVFRAAMLTWAIIALGIVSFEYSKKPNDMNKSVILSTVFYVLYVACVLYNESCLLTSGLTKDAPGFRMILFCNTFVFTYSMPLVFMIKIRPVVPMWALVLISFIYFVGLWILTQSNLQKHRFRMNPYDPRIAHLETIPTSGSKKLLVSGWWGWVCHPNYLGDLLCNFAIVLPAGFTHGFPYLIPCYMVVALVAQAYQDDCACSQKYGVAWRKYRNRVKYRLVPYVY